MGRVRDIVSTMRTISQIGPRLFRTGLSVLAAALLAAKLHAAPDPNFHIYLAFGQSNMEGFPGTIEAQDQTVNPRFRMMAAVDQSDKNRVKGSWYDAIPPLCRSGNGLNPGDYFGRTLVDSLPANIKIGILNVAVAGCAIEMFDKDKYAAYVKDQASWMKDIATGYGGSPYARLVEMAKLAQQDGVIKGIIFHQGESGSSTGQWAAEVKLVFNNLVQDLGLDPKLPFIAGDLVSPSKMVQDLPKTMSNAYVASSQGLEHQPDGQHFKSTGYRELGKRYAALMLPIYKTSGLRGDKWVAGYSLSPLDRRDGMATVSFEIPQRSFVSLKAYSPAGREIAILAGEEFGAGRHAINLGAKALPAGMTVLRINADSFSASRKILVGAE
jgi:hypothetical protein